MKRNAIKIIVFYVFIISNNCIAQNFFEEGSRKYQSNDFKGAIVEFEKYINENKSSRRLIVSAKVDVAYQFAALSSLYICEFEKSKELFSELLKRADYSDELKYSANQSLGIIAYLNNDLHKAIEYFNVAIGSYKKNEDAILSRAIIFYNSGDSINAVKDFNSLVNNENDLLRAISQFYLGERQNGIAQMLKIVELDPSMFKFYQLASLFAYNEDLENSIKYLNLALNNGLNNYPVYLFFDKDFDKFRNETAFIDLLNKFQIEDIYRTKDTPLLTNNIADNAVDEIITVEENITVEEIITIEPTLANDSCYRTYNRINYQSLPIEIKELMKEANCGEIGALPSQANDYTTNYDEGYVIDLNNDNVLEYIFCCSAPSHGPCYGKIYSLINGKWTVVGDIPVFQSGKPQTDIQLLATKSETFHDIYRDGILTTRGVLMKFINGQYYLTYTANEITNKILFHMSHYSNNMESCYFGFSNSADSTLKSDFPTIKGYNKIVLALESEEETSVLKEMLIAKGIQFLNDYNTGQVVFCITKSPN